jgi:hypothetical protein
MDRDKLNKLAEDKRFISGIYNYCDRWCERCPMTSRCLNFAITQEQPSDPETQDLRNTAFWEKLRQNLQVSLELIREAAGELGIDLDTEDAKAEGPQLQPAVDHVCCRVAKTYSRMVDDWFSATEEIFGRAKENTPYQAEEIAPLQEKEGLRGAVEVVRWYQHQIYVKLMRAVRMETGEDMEVLAEFPRDADGSAKVALIGIDRSIAAWALLRQYFPIRLREILEMITLLEGLCGKVEKAFPGARAFIRPGFDKIDLNG